MKQFKSISLNNTPLKYLCVTKKLHIILGSFYICVLNILSAIQSFPMEDAQRLLLRYCRLLKI